MYAAVAGRPSERTLSRIPPMPEGGRPRAIAFDDGVTLIVADVPSHIYNAASLEPRLADLDWVSRSGAAHHAVSEALAESHVVLPFRLFTLFSSEQKAVATLGRSKTRIAQALARLKGRQEWVLRIGAPDPARLPAPQSEPPPATTGTSFLRKKAHTRREGIERAARVKVDATAVFEALRAIADETNARTIEPGTNVLLDAAFLVKTRQTTTFKNTVARTARRLLRDGCPVSLTGPWPPYSFASLD